MGLAASKGIFEGPTNEAFVAQLTAWNATLDQFTSDDQLNALLELEAMTHPTRRQKAGTAG